MSIADVKALTFDVFGTVVDWRASIIRQGEEWGRAKNLTVDWAAFTDAWHDTYRRWGRDTLGFGFYVFGVGRTRE